MVNYKWEVINICYNCGQDLLDDDHGNPNNITTETFKKAAQAYGTSLEEAKENVYKTLKQEFGNEEEPLNPSKDTL